MIKFIDVYSYFYFNCYLILLRAGHVDIMEEGRSAFKILTGTPAGKRPLERTILEWILKRYV